MSRVLIVDDEDDFRCCVADALRDANYDVQECGTADAASGLLQAETFDVLLTDLRMPGREGTHLLREAASRLPDAILIVMTAYGSLETAIESLRIGAHDYLLKPVDLEALVRKVNLLVKHQATLAENRFLRTAMAVDVPASGLIGNGSGMAQVHRLIARVAPTDSTVLITGETGTGKELVARAIHQASPRESHPFVAINCGSIPETLLESELFGHVRGAFTGADRDKSGLFEVAGAGTLFLDEIGEMPHAVQPKILRVLESKEILRVGSTRPVRVSARIVAATHRDLEKMIDEGTFRRDLYYRLNVLAIPLPPLRERMEDIRPLSIHLLERLSRSLNRSVPTLAAEALRLLEQYRWPGNVRELANVLERAMILTDGGRIDVFDLPGLGGDHRRGTDDNLRAARRAFERRHIEGVIGKYGGDKRRAAEALGVDLSSLYRKLEEDE